MAVLIGELLDHGHGPQLHVLDNKIGWQASNSKQPWLCTAVIGPTLAAQ